MGNRTRDLPACSAVPQEFGSYWNQISLGYRISLLKFLVVFFGFPRQYFWCSVLLPLYIVQ